MGNSKNWRLILKDWITGSDAALAPKVVAELSIEGDVEIGAVEIKDAATATRAKVKSDGTDNALVVVQNPPTDGTYIGDVKFGEDLSAGVAITGETLETGGSNILGWLSSIRKAITDRLPAALTTTGSLKVSIEEEALKGTPITGETLETGGAEILGWLSSLRKAITDRLPAALTTAGNLKVSIEEEALQGTPITGETLESGGAGILGWLSSLRKAVTDRLPASLTVGGNLKVALLEAIVAGEAHIGEVGGRVSAVAAAFTRPADPNAYLAKDAVSNATASPLVLTFSNVARIVGGSGHITKARLMTDQSTCVARFRLHLYSVTPTAINDNALFTLLWANRANRVGFIDFPACGTEATGSDTANSLVTPGLGNLPMTFVCAGADRNLYGLLETLDGFTPASAQNFYIELESMLD